MEPFATAAIAIGSLVATKILEKAGEKVGETLCDKTSSFFATLNQQSPETVTTIERALEEPIYYGNAVLEVRSVAQVNPKVNQAMEELAVAAKAEPNANLKKTLQDIASILESQSSLNSTQISTIEKIVNFAQRDINIENQNVTI